MFLFSLYKNDLKTMSEVLYRATKYMNAKDALLAREEKPKKRGKDWKMRGRTKDGRNGERETEGMKDALSPREEGLQASLH